MPYIGNVTTDFNVSTANINNGAVTGEKLSQPFNYDSGTLYLDDTNNRVGLGTISPSYTLDVQGSTVTSRVRGSGGTYALGLYENDSTYFYTGIDTSTGAAFGAGNYARVVWSYGAYPLVFATNNAERLRITSAGLVGIGTSSPAGTLHVNGQTYIQGTVSGGLANSTLIANNSGQAQFWALGADTSTTGSMTFVVARSNLSSSLQAVTIDSSGRVGIGSTTPGTKFHVESNGAGGDVWIKNGAGQNALLEIAGNNNTLGSTSALYGQDASNNVYAGWARGSHPVLFGSGNSEAFRVDTSRRVLVGTSSADTSGNALLQVNGSIKGVITSAVAVASTSGTSIDFTGIPSWVKRITVILSGVSTNGSSGIRFRLGSGSVQTTGYNNRNTIGTTGWNAVSTTTGGFDAFVGAASFMDGSFVFHNPTGNTWIATGLFTTDTPAIGWTGGNVVLSGTLDRVRVTTGNGTDTFDAGSINILYEG